MTRSRIRRRVPAWAIEIIERVSKARRRIARTAFPGKFTRKGSLRYIAVPSSVEERMGLKEGDYLDVVISWPVTEEFDIDSGMNARAGCDNEAAEGRNDSETD